MTDPWWPDGYLDPAFEVQRQVYGPAQGGDYVRGSSVTTLPATALRYRSQVPNFAAAAGKAYLTISTYAQLIGDPPEQQLSYTVAQIAWGWPLRITDNWDEVALVRSGFGAPTTVNDGQTVFRALKTAFTYDIHGDSVVDINGNPTITPAPVIYDQPLQPGQWYYYALFFRVGPLDWIVGMTGQVLIPRNHHHADHLWNAVPPFYQYVDNDPRGRLGGGFNTLRRFLNVFGAEMDQTREYVEAWQDVYHVDRCPFPLLKRVAENWGVTYTSGMGDIRFRGYIAALPTLYKQRGTAPALQFAIEAASKYECDVTLGANLMLLPDDSDFYHGTGNWATLHPDTDTIITDISTLPPTDVRLTSTATDNTIPGPPAGYGRGSMRIQTALSVEGSPFCITCGDGVTVGRAIIPLYTGVPVAVDGTYGFTVWLQCQGASRLIMPSLGWFDDTGQPDGYVSRTDASAPINVTNSWTELTVQGVVPDGVTYLVPMLQIAGLTGSTDPNWSLWVDAMAASVYLLSPPGEIAVLSPDSLLTMGEPEPLGDPTLSSAPAGFEGYVIGDPGGLPT